MSPGLRLNVLPPAGDNLNTRSDMGAYSCESMEVDHIQMPELHFGGLEHCYVLKIPLSPPGAGHSPCSNR